MECHHLTAVRQAATALLTQGHTNPANVAVIWHELQPNTTKHTNPLQVMSALQVAIKDHSIFNQEKPIVILPNGHMLEFAVHRITPTNHILIGFPITHAVPEQEFQADQRPIVALINSYDHPQDPNPVLGPRQAAHLIMKNVTSRNLEEEETPGLRILQQNAPTQPGAFYASRQVENFLKDNPPDPPEHRYLKIGDAHHRLDILPFSGNHLLVKATAMKPDAKLRKLVPHHEPWATYIADTTKLTRTEYEADPATTPDPPRPASLQGTQKQ